MTLPSARKALPRFSRACCAVEPLVLTRAWRLVSDDPAAAAVRELDPAEAVDEALAAVWHRNLSGPWAKHAEAC